MKKVHPFYDKEKLQANLKSARMDVYYRDFAVKSLKAALFLTVIVDTLIYFVVISITQISSYQVLLIMLMVIPVSYYLFFKFMLKTPEVKIIRSKKNIEAEITSVIRFFILDLKANAPVFDALHNIVKNFDEVGLYLNDVLTKVKLGNSLTESLNETVELVPSEQFRIFLWQIINHLQTGTDITTTLDTIVDEIIETQRLEFKRYGKN